jgi:hypothetical protein
MANKEVEAKRYERDKRAVLDAVFISCKRLCKNPNNKDAGKENKGGWPTRGL